MKVLLIKDVYKLGRAGDVKKVANGYGRNYLIPQGMAVLATPHALRQIEQIKAKADKERAILNQEMSGIAEQLENQKLYFSAKAGETGKLYGSVTTQMISDAIKEKIGVEVSRRQIDTQPLRSLGTHKVPIRLTIDLIPEIEVVVYREGEAPETMSEEETPTVVESEAIEELVEVVESSEGEAEVEEVEIEETVEEVVVEDVGDAEETAEVEVEAEEEESES